MTVLPPDTPTIAPSAVDVIVGQIRDIIATDELTVGDKLPTERELCLRFDASRNTVREAMRILKAYGMVDVRPKVGAVITDNRMSRAFDLMAVDTMDVSRKTFADVQSFRDLLEVGAADQLISSANEQDICDLRALNDSLLGNRDVASASEIDHAFHLRLIAILGNDAIRDVYGVMKPVILKIMQIGKTQRSYETQTHSEHVGIIEALEARDRLAFQYRLRSHLMAGFKHFAGEDAADRP